MIALFWLCVSVLVLVLCVVFCFCLGVVFLLFVFSLHNLNDLPLVLFG